MLRGLIAIAACSLLVACGDNREAKKPTATPDSPPSTAEPEAPEEKPPPSYRELIEKRGELDSTVYGNERQAQQYEQTLVALWDRLRNEEPYSVFGGLEFGQLTLGKPGEPDTRDWGVPGIRVTPFNEGGQSLTPAEFKSLLTKWKAEGWNLEQSEWHHDRFWAATDDSPARSLASMTLHLSNPNGERRTILKGKLEIAWAAAKAEASGAALPQSIKVVEMRAVERQGALSFEPMARLDVRIESGGQWQSSNPVILNDLDGDGLSEILLVGANLLYRNKGGGKFEKETLADLPHPLDGAAAVADFTGDGIVDLVGTARRGGLLLLFTGTPDGKFEAPKEVSFPTPFEAAQGLTAGDVDGDGDLDLFLFQYRQPYIGGQMPTPFYDANDGHPSYLLRNEGDGQFSDITEEAGLGKKRHRRSYSATLVNIDGDQHLDLVVVSDFAGVDIYRGDGKGKFEDVTETMVDQRHAFGMAQTLDDFDGDGALDLYMIGMSSTTARRIVGMGIEHPEFPGESKMRMAMGYGNRLFLSRGGRLVTSPAGGSVARTGWSWGVTSADFDNDGDRDIFVANGHVSGQSCQDYCTRFWSHDIFTNHSTADPARERVFFGEMQSMLNRQTSWNGYEKNVLFLNAGGEDFLNAAHLLGVAHEFDSRAVAGDDLDGDGHVDLLVVELDQRRRSEVIHLIRNKGQAGRHWIGVRLRESAGGPSPLGAKVFLKRDGGETVAAIVAGDSYQAQHAPVAHFGLGSEAAVTGIEVRWPNGAVSKLAAPAVDRYHTIEAPVANQP